MSKPLALSGLISGNVRTNRMVGFRRKNLKLELSPCGSRSRNAKHGQKIKRSRLSILSLKGSNTCLTRKASRSTTFWFPWASWVEFLTTTKSSWFLSWSMSTKTDVFRSVRSSRWFSLSKKTSSRNSTTSIFSQVSCIMKWRSRMRSGSSGW